MSTKLNYLALCFHLLVVLYFLSLVSCAPAVNEYSQVSITVKKTAKGSALTTSTGQTVTLPDNVCYGIHVSGEFIDLMKPGEYVCGPKNAFGHFHGLFNKGDTAEIVVPIGRARRFELFGFDKPAAGCSVPFAVGITNNASGQKGITAQYNNNPVEDQNISLPKLYASAIVDVPAGAVTVALEPSFDSSNNLGSSFLLESCEGWEPGSQTFSTYPWLDNNNTTDPADDVLRVGTKDAFFLKVACISGATHARLILPNGTATPTSYDVSCESDSYFPSGLPTATFGVASAIPLPAAIVATLTVPPYYIGGASIILSNAAGTVAEKTFRIAFTPHYNYLSTTGGTAYPPVSISPSTVPHFAGLHKDPATNVRTLLVNHFANTTTDTIHGIRISPTSLTWSGAADISINDASNGVLGAVDKGLNRLIYVNFDNTAAADSIFYQDGDLSAGTNITTNVTASPDTDYYNFVYTSSFASDYFIVAAGKYVGTSRVYTNYGDGSTADNFADLPSMETAFTSLNSLAVEASASLSTDTYISYLTTSGLNTLTVLRCVNYQSCHTGGTALSSNTATYSAQEINPRNGSSKELLTLKLSGGNAAGIIYPLLTTAQDASNAFIPAQGVNINSSAFHPAWDLTPTIKFVKVLKSATGQQGQVRPGAELVAGGSSNNKGVIYRSYDYGRNWFKVYESLTANTIMTDAHEIVLGTTPSYYGFAIIEHNTSSDTYTVLIQNSHGY